MKGFNLGHFKATEFYKEVMDHKGILVKDLETIEECLEDIDLLKSQSTNTRYVRCETTKKLKSKITYTEKCIDILEVRIRNEDNDRFLNFLYNSETYPKKKEFRSCHDMFVKATAEIHLYLYKAKKYLVEAELSLAEHTQIEDILGIQAKHLLAINQSLLPSAQSIASVFVSQLSEAMEKNASINQVLPKEAILNLTKQAATELANHLYKEENSVATEMLNGMREHYIQKLTEFETLNNENIQLRSLLDKAHNTNGELKAIMKKQTVESHALIESLKDQVNEKNVIVAEKDEIIKQKDSSIQHHTEACLKKAKIIEELSQVLEDKVMTDQTLPPSVPKYSFFVTKNEAAMLENNHTPLLENSMTKTTDKNKKESYCFESLF